MDHQDWKPVILRKPKALLPKPKKEKVLSNVKPNSNSASVNARKLEEVDIPIQKKTPKEVYKEIQQARTLKKMSQQDLATRLSVKKSIINDLESGKMPYDKKFISKVKNVLGIK